MAYLFRQRFHLSELAELPEQPARRVLLVEPETYRAGLYRRHLEPAFCVDHLPALPAWRGPETLGFPHVAVVSCEAAPSLGALTEQLARFVRFAPHVPVVTLAYDLSTEDLKLLMALGVASHLNRALSRPQDLPAVLLSVLAPLSN